MSGQIVEVRQDGRRTLHVLVRDQLEIGRECDGLLLADGEVSRRHCRLDLVDDGIQVVDLGSTNGTLHNGVRITNPVVLGPEDVVRFGSTEVTLFAPARAQTLAPPVAAAPARGTIVQQAPAAAPAPAPAPPPADAATKVVAASPSGGGDARATSILKVAAAVQEQPPTVQSAAGDGDTITIVFSDIESSTEQALRLGDARWFDVLGTHNRIVRTNLRHFGGREIKSQGDGFMLTFNSARKAVQFCVAVQQELEKWDRDNPDDAVRIRIGAHTGEAIVDDDGDLFGKHIIVAARIANLADGAEILVSHVVKEITSSRGDLEFGPGRSVDLKGIEEAYKVHQVLWEP